MKIGFIGLGIMGKPMAKNLLKAGHEVWVNNRSQAPLEELVALGAHGATRRELAENAEVVITMLPNGPQVKEVMLGEVADYMHAGQIFIDCSSISPVVSKEIAAVLTEKGIEVDREQILKAHKLYVDNCLGARDDAIGMQYLIPGWKFDNKKPCLVR